MYAGGGGRAPPMPPVAGLPMAPRSPVALPACAPAGTSRGAEGLESMTAVKNPVAWPSSAYHQQQQYGMPQHPGPPLEVLPMAVHGATRSTTISSEEPARPPGACLFDDAPRMGVPSQSQLRFMSASASRQHPIKRDTGMIMADCTEESSTLLGLADGVSEVQSMGISPDEFPREYLRNFREKLETRGTIGASEWHNGRPQVQDDGSWIISVMEESFDVTMSYGSTTLLLAVIEDSNRLVVGNLGDSYLLLLRPEPRNPSRLQIAYKTEPLRYDTNKPYQIARLEGVEDARVRSVLQHTRVDAFPAQHGDLVVLGSDGLFDNLHDEDVVRIVEQYCHRSLRPGGSILVTSDVDSAIPAYEQLEGAADALVREAIDAVCVGQVDDSGQIRWPPHARQTPVGFGGKADDTTAIVGVAMMVNDCGGQDELTYKAHHHRGGWFQSACCGQTRPSDMDDEASCTLA